MVMMMARIVGVKGGSGNGRGNAIYKSMSDLTQGGSFKVAMGHMTLATVMVGVVMAGIHPCCSQPHHPHTT